MPPGGSLRPYGGRYDVPETYEDMAHMKKENPQGLLADASARLQV